MSLDKHNATEKIIKKVYERLDAQVRGAREAEEYARTGSITKLNLQFWEGHSSAYVAMKEAVVESLKQFLSDEQIEAIINSRYLDK